MQHMGIQMQRQGIAQLFFRSLIYIRIRRSARFGARNCSRYPLRFNRWTSSTQAARKFLGMQRNKQSSHTEPKLVEKIISLWVELSGYCKFASKCGVLKRCRDRLNWSLRTFLVLRTWKTVASCSANSFNVVKNLHFMSISHTKMKLGSNDFYSTFRKAFSRQR